MSGVLVKGLLYLVGMAAASVAGISASGLEAKQSQAEVPAQTPKCKFDGVSVDDSTITFCGPINLSDSDKVREILSSKKISDFAISSPGGFTSDAIEIAEMLNVQNVSVSVFGQCLSSCAHFIFAGAQDVYVFENSVIAFHHTGASQEALLRESELEVPREVAAIVAARSSDELSYYGRANIDIKLLTKPFREMRPKCVVKSALSDAPPRVSARGAWVMWTPTREFIERMRGREVHGWWPKTRYDLYRAVNTNFPEIADPQIFKFQHSTELDDGPPLDTIDWCQE